MQVLKKNDFDFTTKNFWWKIIEQQLQDIVDLEEDVGLKFLRSEELRHYKRSREAIKTILNKVGYSTSEGNWAAAALWWWSNKRLNSFGK